MTMVTFFNFMIFSVENIDNNNLSKAFESFRQAFSGNLFDSTAFMNFFILPFFVALFIIAVIVIIKFLKWRKNRKITEETMESVYKLMGLTEDDVKLLKISAYKNKLKPYYKIILYKSSFKRYLNSHKARELGINIDYLQRKIFRE